MNTVHNLILFLFQAFPISIGKDNGIYTSLKAAENSREVSGTIKEHLNKLIASFGEIE